MKRELYRIEQLPIYQNCMFKTKSAAISCPKGDIILVQDTQTGLIFNSAFNPNIMKYGKDYQNEQSNSYVFREHLDTVTNIIRRHFTKKPLIEIGCGKGYFLEHLQRLGYSITGIDPTYEGNNPNIIKSTFDPSLGLKSDGIILRHILEHIHNPVEFLHTIKNSNSDSSKVYIEVPCFNWICRNRTWFDIYYEHANYFRMNDIIGMFDIVFESGYLFGGQYLYIIADLNSLRKHHATKNDLIIFPKNFSPDYQYKLLNQNTQLAVWGAASKGVIFTLILQRLGINIDLAIDINPFKQGKYLAGSGIKIYSPMESMQILDANATIFVMNSNYINEIKQLTNSNFHLIAVDKDTED